MKKATPMPIGSPISKGDQLTLAYSQWMQSVAGFMYEGTNEQVAASGVSYYMLGAVCYISITSAGTWQLPYKVLKPRYIKYMANGTESSLLLDIGANSITLAGAGIVLCDWYLAELAQ